MKNQMRALSPFIFSLLFFVLLVSCVRSSDVEAPSNITSFDLYTYSFLSLFPPFVCPKPKSPVEQESDNSLFDLQTKNYDEITEDIFGSDSPFNKIPDLPEFMEALGKDPAFDNSLKAFSLRRNDNLGSDVNLQDLVKHASKVLFGKNFDLSSNSSALLNEAAAADGTCTEAMAGRGECQAGDVFATGSSFALPGLNFEVGSLATLICIVAHLKLNVSNPENLGTIMCECAQTFPSGFHVCPFVSFLSKKMACSSAGACPSLFPTPYVPPEDPKTANLPLQGKLPTPKKIDQDVIDSEMQTYYLLTRSLLLMYYDAENAACDPKWNKTSSIAGWNVEQSVNLVETKPGKPGARVPFARLSARPNQANKNLTDYLVTVRGTMTSGEWGVDYTYNQIPIALNKTALNKTDITLVHHGFAALASSVFGIFQHKLEKQFSNGTLGLITITGHSLGGGVANVLGELVSRQFGSYLPDKSTPRVRVVAFAPGRSGPNHFVTELSKNVVMRTIEAVFDPIPRIPCNSMLGCPAHFVPVPTARDLSTEFKYATGLGLVGFGQLDLPAGFSQSGSNLKIAAWHFCSYFCWTSTHADPTHQSLCRPPSQVTFDNFREICPFLATNFELL